MAHPRNVGWGEIGLDYHYDNSPRDVQREVFSRQLRHAVRLGKPVTVHTREADEDTERILKAEVPKDHKVQYLRRTRRIDYSLIAFLSLSHRTGENKKLPSDTCPLLHRFPRFCTAPIGSLPEPVHRHHWHAPFPVLSMNASRPPAKWTDTFLSSVFSGVITFSSNENTSNLVRQMFAQSPSPRVILETDAPFMVPANIYGSLPEIKGRLPLCHTAMIPWTAEVVATVAGEGWDIDRVLELGKINAHSVYGI